MNPLSFFNSTSLLFLGVLVLCCALLFAYFENKAREQNHKISSMLSLVSSLTEEVQSIKRHIQSGSHTGGMVKQNIYQNQDEYQQEGDDDVEDEDEDDDLVSVSDDYGDDDDEDVDVSDDDDEDEEDEDDDDEDANEDENQVIEIGDNVKILTLLQPIELVSDGEDDNTEYDADDLLEDDDLKSVSSKDENETKEEANEPEEVKMFDLKSIHLEEPIVVDYKKLSIGKLRSLVAEKGIVEDTSRMKKPDLLKLLGVE